MSDEEKSIEEIIAELESLEKQAKEEEQRQATQKDGELLEDLTLDETREDASSEDHLDSSIEARDGKSQYEEIFIEEPPDKSHVEIEIEELSEDISMKDGNKEKLSEEIQSDDHTLGNLSFEESAEELTLDKPIEIQTTKDADVPGLFQDVNNEGKKEEAGSSEISLETEDITLKKLSLEEPRTETTVDTSDEIVRDDESFELLSMEQDACDAASKDLSINDEFDAPLGDRPLEAREDPVFDDQAVKLSTEELHMEQMDDEKDQYLSDKKFHEEVPPGVPFAMSSGEEPPEKPSTDEMDDLPPDEPPPETKAPLRLSRVAVLMGLFLVAVVMYGILVWPKLYEYRSVKSGDVRYQVKINRITKTQQYFDAGSWHRGSIPAPMPQTARHKIEPKLTTEAEDAKAVIKETIALQNKQEEQAAVIAQGALPEKVEAKGMISEKERASEAKTTTVEEKPVGTTATATDADSSIPEQTIAPDNDGEVKEPEQQKAEQIVTAAVAAERKPQQTQGYAEQSKTKQYVIQLSSMRLEEFADDLVGVLKQKGWSAYKDIVRGKDKDPWYLVFIGGFATRGDAVTFMKNNKIENSYPGSYIRAAYLSTQAVKK